MVNISHRRSGRVLDEALVRHVRRQEHLDCPCGVVEERDDLVFFGGARRVQELYDVLIVFHDGGGFTIEVIGCSWTQFRIPPFTRSTLPNGPRLGIFVVEFIIRDCTVLSLLF